MASKPDRSSPDELAEPTDAIEVGRLDVDRAALEASIDGAAAAFCSADQGVVFLEDEDEPMAMSIAIAEAERVRGRAISILWALDRSWLAWHWPADGATPLVGFMLSDDRGESL